MNAGHWYIPVPPPIDHLDIHSLDFSLVRARLAAPLAG